MVAIASSVQNDVVAPVDGRANARNNRLLKMWDIGVLLAALVFFLAFLALLIRIVFPQGPRLTDLTLGGTAALFEVNQTGEVDLAGTGVSNLSGFIARLGDVKRDVKIRAAGSIAWGSARKGVSVHNRDALQTFANSRARVDFTTDNELQIGQNSLIVFRSGAADPFLERREPAAVMMDGELTGAVNAEYGAFAVQFPAGLVEMTAEDGSDEPINFRIGVNADNSSTISIFSGRADVNIAGDHYLVGANHGLTITEDGKSAGIQALPSLPVIRRPGARTVAKYLGAPPRVNFQWSRVSNAQNYRLEIAKDTRFTDILVDEYLDGTSFTHANLAPGNYFWRVSARAGWIQGPASLPRRLAVVQDSEPPLLELQTIQHVGAGRYVLRGRTARDAKVHVFGQLVKTSPGGNFEYLFNPKPGTQSIVVESIDAVGNVAYGSQVLHVPGNPGRSD